MKDSVIVNPFTPIPKSDKSHTRGWAMLWAERLNADIATKDTDLSEYKNIYIDHGVNFSGSLNLFGGFTDECYEGCENLITAFNGDSKLFSLDLDITDIDYVGQIESRIGGRTTSKFVNTEFLNDLEEALNSAETWDMDKIESDHIIIGDSHSLAYSSKDSRIYYQNGSTLYSTLKLGVAETIHDRVHRGTKYRDYKTVDLCFGSIDNRFHACRLDIDPRQVAKNYVEQCVFASKQLRTKINICTPVPIEHESRRIPKSGMYKGQPFYGTYCERTEWLNDFIDHLCDYIEKSDTTCVNLIGPPEEWYYMDPYDYMKEIMELGSSVHIAPKNYRSIKGW